MNKLKLNMEHNVVLDMVVPHGDRFVLCYLPREEAYATWAVDKEGNCYWGHYGFRILQDAIADLMKRAAVPVTIARKGEVVISQDSYDRIARVAIDIQLAELMEEGPKLLQWSERLSQALAGEPETQRSPESQNLPNYDSEYEHETGIRKI